MRLFLTVDELERELNDLGREKKRRVEAEEECRRWQEREAGRLRKEAREREKLRRERERGEERERQNEERERGRFKRNEVQGGRVGKGKDMVEGSKALEQQLLHD